MISNEEVFMSLNRYEYFLEHFTGQLPVGESFDLVERHIKIAGKPGRMYFVDGLTDGQNASCYSISLWE